jgi:hypothetical protein
VCRDWPRQRVLVPVTLYPGSTTPAKPAESTVLYANGFGPASAPVVSGSLLQAGTLAPAPVIKIGGVTASVFFAGLVERGEFQFNVVVPVFNPRRGSDDHRQLPRLVHSIGNIDHDQAATAGGIVGSY